jgi:hypothetical protein
VEIHRECKVDLHKLTHGPTSFLFAYVLVLIPMWVGLWRGRARLRQWLKSPFTAVVVMLVAGIAWTALSSGAEYAVEMRKDTFAYVVTAAAFVALVGYFGGRYFALEPPEIDIVRGTHIVDGRDVQQKTKRLSRKHGACWVTVSGVILPIEDETKHLRVIAANGPGKTAVIQEVLASVLARGDCVVTTDPDGQHSAALYNTARGDLVLPAEQLERVSVADWVRAGRGALFLPYASWQLASIRPLLQHVLHLVMMEAMQPRADGRRWWLVVEEPDAVGAIEGLGHALGPLGRAGTRCVLGFESHAQFMSAYGYGDGQAIMDNCGNTLILRCAGAQTGGTAHFASQVIGERQVRRLEYAGGGTSREQIVTEMAVESAEIQGLGDFVGYLHCASDQPWIKVNFGKVG